MQNMCVIMTIAYPIVESPFSIVTDRGSVYWNSQKKVEKLQSTLMGTLIATMHSSSEHKLNYINLLETCTEEPPPKFY